MRSTVRATLAVALALTVIACVPRAGRPVGAAARPGPVERGAVLYAAYCRDCHGAAGRGDGAVARVFGLHPADLRSSLGAADGELIARVRRGDPLRVGRRSEPRLEDRQIAELIAHVRVLGRRDAEHLRIGRFVFERECAGCHGVYGDGEPLLEGVLGVAPPSLRRVRDRYPTDEALMRVSQYGFRRMPAAPAGAFQAGELRAVAGYVRDLSEGGRLYDAHCAACHGLDGRGVGPALPTGGLLAGPPLRVPSATADVRVVFGHMLRREQTTMPHFGTLLPPARVRDIVAYLRSW